VRRREGGREGEVIPRVWEGTVAAEGMFGNLNPLGDGPGRSLADHGARVPEVLPAAELEGDIGFLVSFAHQKLAVLYRFQGGPVLQGSLLRPPFGDGQGEGGRHAAPVRLTRRRVRRSLHPRCTYVLCTPANRDGQPPGTVGALSLKQVRQEAASALRGAGQTFVEVDYGSAAVRTEYARHSQAPALVPTALTGRPWGHTHSLGNAKVVSCSDRLLFSLRYSAHVSGPACLARRDRKKGVPPESFPAENVPVCSARQPMHGGGEDAAEGTAAVVEEPRESQGGRGTKRVLTPEEEAARRARREQIAHERATKLAKIASGESGLGKVRQHVNPLAPGFREPIPTPDWQRVYADASRPLHIDMGCGKGRMLLEMAKLQPHRNFLGVEIREPLVVRADRWVREEGLRNLHYVSGNINVSLKSVLASYPGALDLVSVLMPDPWFKKRHKKRRLLQPELVEQVAALMKPGARFFVMSDVQVCPCSSCAVLGRR